MAIGDLQDELIQNSLVVCIRDSKSSERLQLDTDLTLDKAVTIIWQSGMMHGQKFFHRGDDTRQIPIHAVKSSRKPVNNTSDTG